MKNIDDNVVNVKNLEYNSWAIYYDDVLTRQVNNGLVSGSEECVRENCKNFLSARDKSFNLQKFGIIFV